jgi:hypothetical protein
MSAEEIRLHTQDVIRRNTLTGETIDTLDNAIQLLSMLGSTELADQIHDVLIKLDSYLKTDVTAQRMTKYEDLDNVINMFAHKNTKVSA